MTSVFFWIFAVAVAGISVARLRDSLQAGLVTCLSTAGALHVFGFHHHSGYDLLSLESAVRGIMLGVAPWVAALLILKVGRRKWGWFASQPAARYGSLFHAVVVLVLVAVVTMAWCTQAVGQVRFCGLNSVEVTAAFPEHTGSTVLPFLLGIAFALSIPKSPQDHRATVAWLSVAFLAVSLGSWFLYHSWLRGTPLPVVLYVKVG